MSLFVRNNQCSMRCRKCWWTLVIMCSFCGMQLVLLGDSGVGKSCIVLRFVRGQFDPSSKVRQTRKVVGGGKRTNVDYFVDL